MVHFRTHRAERSCMKALEAGDDGHEIFAEAESMMEQADTGVRSFSRAAGSTDDPTQHSLNKRFKITPIRTPKNNAVAAKGEEQKEQKVDEEEQKVDEEAETRVSLDHKGEEEEEKKVEEEEEVEEEKEIAKEEKTQTSQDPAGGPAQEGDQPPPVVGWPYVGAKAVLHGLQRKTHLNGRSVEVYEHEGGDVWLCRSGSSEFRAGKHNLRCG